MRALRQLKARKRESLWTAFWAAARFYSPGLILAVAMYQPPEVAPFVRELDAVLSLALAGLYVVGWLIGDAP